MSALQNAPERCEAATPQKHPAPDRLLDVNEAAALLGLRPRTLYKMSYERRIPTVKIGRSTRFRQLTLLRLMEEWERPATKPQRQDDGGLS